MSLNSKHCPMCGSVLLAPKVGKHTLAQMVLIAQYNYQRDELMADEYEAHDIAFAVAMETLAGL